MIAGCRPIPRVHAPSVAQFERNYLRPRQPVVISGALDGRPALSRWSLEHLADVMGDAPVKLRSSPRGRAQRFDGEYETAFDFRTLPLREALAGVADSEHTICYVQHADLRQAPELAAEIGMIDYAPARLCSHALLWVSAPGAITPLHWDTHHVALAQIQGQKAFVLFPPDDSAKLASFVDRTVWRTSALDLSARERAVDRATAWSATLAPGEVLFIPYRWWHYMQSDQLSISVSWWWAPSLVAHARDSARERAVGIVQRVLRKLTSSGARPHVPTRASSQSPRAG